MEIPCPTCPTWSHFIPDKLKIYIYLSLDKYKCLFHILINYYYSHLALKTVWILDLHCLQEKPAAQDPYCLQELIHIWFHIVFERINCSSTVRYKLICSFGQVKFSMDKYISAFYLSLDNYFFLLFPHP